jgi:hypothetical protein
MSPVRALDEIAAHDIQHVHRLDPALHRFSSCASAANPPAITAIFRHRDFPVRA